MPEVTVVRAREYRAAADSARKTQAYDIPLHLPSSLSPCIPTSLKLADYEFRLRMAQADESLEELRQQLRLRSHIWYFKDKNIRSQKSNTRARTLLNGVQYKIDASGVKYAAARNAVASLSQRTGAVGWDSQLKELAKEDIRAFTDDTEEVDEAKRQHNRNKPQRQGLGEGQKKMSWIWVTSSIAGDSNDKGLLEGAPPFTLRSL